MRLRLRLRLWNWGQNMMKLGQNMMKLGSKHGEIHILCTTTFCTLSVPNNGYIGYIVSFVPSFWVHIFSSNGNALKLSCDRLESTSSKAEQWSHVVLWFCGSGVKVYIGAMESCGSVVQESKCTSEQWNHVVLWFRGQRSKHDEIG